MDAHNDPDDTDARTDARDDARGDDDAQRTAAVPTPADDAPAAGEPDAHSPAEGNHFGQDGGRESVSVSAAQKERGADATQSGPAMSQNNAGADEKLDGIIAQTRADLPDESAARIAEVLLQRAAQVGVTLSDDEAARIAASLGSD